MLGLTPTCSTPIADIARIASYRLTFGLNQSRNQVIILTGLGVVQ